MADPVAMETKETENELDIKDEPVEECISPVNLEEMDSCLIKEETPDAMPYVDNPFLFDDSLLIIGEFPAQPFSDVREEPAEEDMPLPIIEDVFTLGKGMEINEADTSQIMEITEQATHKKSDEIGLTSQKAQKTAASKDDVQLPKEPAEQSASSQATLQHTEAATTQSNVVNKLTSEAQYRMNHKQNTSSVNTASSIGVQTSTPNALHLAVLQQIMSMHQAGRQPQNMNVPHMGIPNIGILQNTTNAPVNQQQMNMMQFGGPRATANLAPFGTPQNRIGVPRVPMTLQRLGVPRVRMQLPSQSVGVSQFGLASLRPNEQEQMMRAQLNMLQNAQLQGTNAQQLGIQPQVLFLAQLNAFQEMCATQVGMQTEQRSAPQLVLPVHGQQLRQPMDGSHMTLQQNMFNTQHQRAGGNATAPNISQSNTGTPQVGRNVSHLTTIPRLRAPQLGNMLQFRAPHISSMPRLRMPHLNPNMQQLARNVPPIPSNMQRLGIPRLPPNVPHVGVPPLTSNMQQQQQQLNVPHITSNMPPVGGSQIPNVSHVGVSQVSNMPQIHIPHLGKGISQVMGNVSQLRMPQCTTNSVSVPNVARNVHQLPMPPLPVPNLSRFGAPLVAANVPPMNMPQTHSNIPHFRAPPPPRNPSKLGLQPLATPLSMSQKGTTVPSLGVQAIATSVPQVTSNIPRLGITQQAMNMPRHSGPRPTTNVHVRMPQPAQMGMQMQRTGVSQFNAAQSAHTAQLAARQQTEQIAWINRKQQVAGGQQRVTGVKQQLSGVLQQSVNTSQQSASAPQPVHGQKRIDFHLAKMPHKLSENQREQIILKHIQRKRMRRHLALLNWWKRYERFRVVKSMFEANRRNVQLTRLNQQLQRQQQHQ